MANVKQHFAGTFEMQPSIADIIERWEAGDLPDTVAALRELPSISPDDSVVFDLVFEELRLRRERDLPIDMQRLKAEFPSHAQTVDEFIQCQLAIYAETEAICDNLFDATSLFDHKPRFPAVGQSWLGFELLEIIGETPHSTIYLARDPSTGARLVTIKISSVPTLEPKLQGPLVHPNVMPILCVVGPDEFASVGTVMPYWGKATIADLIRNTWQTRSVRRDANCLAKVAAKACGYRVPECPEAAQHAPARSFSELVLQIGIQIAQALVYVHRKGIVHCDLKPSNLLATPSSQVILIDFNLSQGSPTSDEPLGGTLPYMSPERISSLLSLAPTTPITRASAREDLYSLGVTLFQLAFGKLPFPPPPSSLPFKAQLQEMLKTIRQGASLPAPRSDSEERLLALIKRLIGLEHPQFTSAESFLVEAQKESNYSRHPRSNSARSTTSRRLGLTLAVCLCLLITKQWALAPATHPVTTLASEALLLSGPRSALARLFVSLHPNDARGWIALGNLFANDGLLDLGAESYARAESLRDQSEIAQNNQGVIAWKKGEFQRAEALFTQAIQSRPHFAAALYNRGRLRQERLANQIAFGQLAHGSIDHSRQLRRIAEDFRTCLDGESLDSHSSADARLRLHAISLELGRPFQSQVAATSPNP